MMFTYGADDVFIHEYVNDETLSVDTYMSFIPDGGNVKHMHLITLDYDLYGDSILPYESLIERDGAMIFTPNEIVMFSTKKIRSIVDDVHNVKCKDVHNYLTRLNVEKNE